MKKTTKKLMSAIVSVALLASSGIPTFADSIAVTKNARIYAETFDGFDGTNAMNSQTKFVAAKTGDVFNSILPNMAVLNTAKGSSSMNVELDTKVKDGKVSVEFDYIPGYWNVANVTGSCGTIDFKFKGGGDTFSFNHVLNVGKTANGTANSKFNINGTSVDNMPSKDYFNAWNLGVGNIFIGNHIKVDFDFDTNIAHIKILKNETTTSYVPDGEYETLYDQDIPCSLTSLDAFVVTTTGTATSTNGIYYYAGIDNCYIDTVGEGESVTEDVVNDGTIIDDTFDDILSTGATNSNIVFNTTDKAKYTNSTYPDMITLYSNNERRSMNVPMPTTINNGVVDVEFDYIPSYWNVASVTASCGKTVFSFVGGGKTFAFTNVINPGNTANATKNSNFVINGTSVQNVSTSSNLNALNYGIRSDVNYVGNHIKVSFDFGKGVAHVVIGKAESNTSFIAEGPYTTIYEQDVPCDLSSLEYFGVNVSATSTSNANISYYSAIDNLKVVAKNSKPATVTKKTLFAEDFTGFNAKNPISDKLSLTGNKVNATANDSFYPNCITLVNGEKNETQTLNAEMSEVVNKGIVELSLDFLPQYWPGTADTGVVKFEVNDGTNSYEFAKFTLGSNGSNGTGTAYYTVDGNNINVRASEQQNFVCWGTRYKSGLPYTANKIKLTLDLDNGTGHVSILQTEWADTKGALPPANSVYSSIYEQDVTTDLTSLKNLLVTASSVGGNFYYGIDNIFASMDVENNMFIGSIQEDTTSEIYESASIDSIKAIESYKDEQYVLSTEAKTEDVSSFTNKFEVKFTAPMSSDDMINNISLSDSIGNIVPIKISLNGDTYIIDILEALETNNTYSLEFNKGLKTVSKNEIGVDYVCEFSTVVGNLSYSEFKLTNNGKAITTVEEFKSATAPIVYYKGGNNTGIAAQTILIIAYYEGDEFVSADVVPYQFASNYSTFEYVMGVDKFDGDYDNVGIYLWKDFGSVIPVNSGIKVK